MEEQEPKVENNLPQLFSFQYQFVASAAEGGFIAEDRYSQGRKVHIWPIEFTAKPDLLAMIDFQSAIYDFRAQQRKDEPALLEVKEDSFKSPPIIYIIEEFKEDSHRLAEKPFYKLLTKHLGRWLREAEESEQKIASFEVVNSDSPAPMEPRQEAPEPMEAEPLKAAVPQQLPEPPLSAQPPEPAQNFSVPPTELSYDEELELPPYSENSADDDPLIDSFKPPLIVRLVETVHDMDEQGKTALPLLIFPGIIVLIFFVMLYAHIYG